MNPAPPARDPFTPSAFFERARQRLPGAVATAADPGGDHVLNPDLAPGAITYRDAAVLIPVVAQEPAASVILTQRTRHLSTHAGQIAFPGGKIEADDAGPAAAAIREAGEEIGLDPAQVSVIGLLNPYLSRTGFRIVPVLARVEPGYKLTINAEEVADAFEVPLAFLMTPTNHLQATRLFDGRPRYFYEMPFGDRYIWGVTAGIIRRLYEQVIA